MILSKTEWILTIFGASLGVANVLGLIIWTLGYRSIWDTMFKGPMWLLDYMVTGWSFLCLLFVILKLVGFLICQKRNFETDKP